MMLVQMIRTQRLLSDNPNLHGLHCDGDLIKCDISHNAILEVEAVFGNANLYVDSAFRADFHKNRGSLGNSVRADRAEDSKFNLFGDIGEVLVHIKDCFDGIANLSWLAIVCLVILLEVVEFELQLGAGLENTRGQ